MGINPVTCSECGEVLTMKEMTGSGQKCENCRDTVSL